MSSYAVDEPIYALATPPYPSALAVIRASGKDSHSLFAPFFTGRAEKGAHHGFIKDIDEVMAIFYADGRGYTGEEAFEIMSHGSPAVVRKICRLLEAAGFRQALPGEFTYRAFMHGRLDLTEAEAVEEIVKSKSDRASSDALMRLTGSIKRAADDAKERILDILASLEVQLDYGEDEIPEQWIFPASEMERLISTLEGIASTYRSSRLYSQGALVVLAGRTNAGKSSLYNALLKEERAIVSPIEGTTRDYIETEALLDGIPVRLVDTAGLREGAEEIEEEGIRRTGMMIQDADLVVYVLDGNEEAPDGDYLFVRSKSDLTGRHDGLSFSALTGEGIEDVIKAIAQALSDTETDSGPRIDSERQRDRLLEAAAALRDAISAKDDGYDIIAMYLQSALSSLSDLTGEITTEDVLERLFSQFCLGK